MNPTDNIDQCGTIVIAGGAGYLGKLLAEYFTRQSYRVVILSRQRREDTQLVRFVLWNGETLASWASELEGATAVINLAGRTVNCRYNAKNKQEIYDSRLNSTRVLGLAIAACQNPPKVWINSSSATIYRHAEDRPMDEATGEIGTGFSVDVCLQWEKVLTEAQTPTTRKIALRSAMVFGPGRDGVMEAFHRLVRLGLGGTLGKGTQFMSWVHIEDFVRSIQWIMNNPLSSGPVNCAAPHPVPNAEFMRTFREVCGRSVGLPANRWMLELGAVFLRTETELLLKSRRVIPGRLLDSGFQFKYPRLREALDNIVNANHHR
ncbi:MAG: hypothetical protein JWQ71_4181 [Pedosphaera sp.]|nr:hypothetical protein [Pedosphaera sp.]